MDGMKATGVYSKYWTTELQLLIAISIDCDQHLICDLGKMSDIKLLLYSLWLDTFITYFQKYSGKAIGSVLRDAYA